MSDRPLGPVLQGAEVPLTDAVERAMREAAGRAILPRFGMLATHEMEDKGAGELVTIADRESEAILSERLARLISGANVVGEEAVHGDPALMESMHRGTCWIIDPLDGTGNFAAGTGPFGILVALVQDGVPVGGWILDPLSGRFCAALTGQGATIDGETLRAQPSVRQRPVAAVTRLFADSAERGRLLTSLAPCHEVLDSPRCAADIYPRIAEGDIDVALFTRTLPWDHAAGVVFLNEAGGRAARPDGSAYRCDGRHGMIAATCPRAWEAMAMHVAQSGVTLCNSGAAA